MLGVSWHSSSASLGKTDIPQVRAPAAPGSMWGPILQDKVQGSLFVVLYIVWRVCVWLDRGMCVRWGVGLYGYGGVLGMCVWWSVGVCKVGCGGVCMVGSGGFVRVCGRMCGGK